MIKSSKANIGMFISVKQAMLTKVIIWFLILCFSINNVTYGYELKDTLRTVRAVETINSSLISQLNDLRVIRADGNEWLENLLGSTDAAAIRLPEPSGNIITRSAIADDVEALTRAIEGAEDLKNVIAKLLDKSDENPLSVLSNPDVYDWLSKLMYSHYEKFGITQKVADRTLEVLAANAGDPEAAREKVLTEVFDYLDPDAAFGRKVWKSKEGRFSSTAVELSAYIEGGLVADIGGDKNDIGKAMKESGLFPGMRVIGTDVARPDGVYEDEDISFRVQPTFTTIDIGDEEADSALLMFVLHHATYEDQVALLEDIYRTMKPGAKLVIYEDTFSDEEEPPYRGEIPGLFDEYDKFDKRDKIAIIKFGEWVNKRLLTDRDYLSNVYPRSIEDWDSLFQEVGFIAEEKHLDFRETGKDLYLRGVIVVRKPLAGEIDEVADESTSASGMEADDGTDESPLKANLDMLVAMEERIESFVSESTKKVHLAMFLHGQDPYGNDIFPQTVDEQVRNFIEPMADMLEKNPFLKVSIHFAGPQLNRLEQAYPRVLAKYQMLHERGQVEIVGGTDGEIFEGVFDYRLMVDDLVRLSDRIYRLFGERPQVAWAAERLKLALRLENEGRITEIEVEEGFRRMYDAGYRYLACADDNIFDWTAKKYGIDVRDEDVVYRLKKLNDEGKDFRILKGSNLLRQALPFWDIGSVGSYMQGKIANKEEVIRQGLAELRALQESVKELLGSDTTGVEAVYSEFQEKADLLEAHKKLTMLFGDDFDKFGGWPGMYENCYGAGQWLPQFAELCNPDNQGSPISTELVSDFVSKIKPVDIEGIASGAYTEFSYWALTPEERQRLIELDKEIENLGKDKLFEGDANMISILDRLAIGGVSHDEIRRLSESLATKGEMLDLAGERDAIHNSCQNLMSGHEYDKGAQNVLYSHLMDIADILGWSLLGEEEASMQGQLNEKKREYVSLLEGGYAGQIKKYPFLDFTIAFANWASDKLYADSLKGIGEEKRELIEMAKVALASGLSSCHLFHGKFGGLKSKHFREYTFGALSKTLHLMAEAGIDIKPGEELFGPHSFRGRFVTDENQWLVVDAAGNIVFWQMRGEAGRLNPVSTSFIDVREYFHHPHGSEDGLSEIERAIQNMFSPDHSGGASSGGTAGRKGRPDQSTRVSVKTIAREHFYVEGMNLAAINERIGKYGMWVDEADQATVWQSGLTDLVKGEYILCFEKRGDEDGYDVYVSNPRDMLQYIPKPGHYLGELLDSRMATLGMPVVTKQELNPIAFTRGEFDTIKPEIAGAPKITPGGYETDSFYKDENDDPFISLIRSVRLEEDGSILQDFTLTNISGNDIDDLNFSLSSLLTLTWFSTVKVKIGDKVYDELPQDLSVIEEDGVVEMVLEEECSNTQITFSLEIDQSEIPGFDLGIASTYAANDGIEGFLKEYNGTAYLFKLPTKELQNGESVKFSLRVKSERLRDDFKIDEHVSGSEHIQGLISKARAHLKKHTSLEGNTIEEIIMHLYHPMTVMDGSADESTSPSGVEANQPLSTPRDRYVYLKAYWFNQFLAYNREEIMVHCEDEVGFGVFMLYYMIYYFKNEVGKEFFDDYFTFLSVENIPNDVLRSLVEIDDEEELKKAVVDIVRPGDVDSNVKQFTMFTIDKIMEAEGLRIEDKAARREDLISRNQRAYALMGMDADKEREELVRALTSVSTVEQKPLTTRMVIYHLTSQCDGNCAHCEIANKTIKLAAPEDRQRFYDAGIEYVKAHPDLETLVLGGEVMQFGLDETHYIVSESEGTIFVTTNGSFATDLETTEREIGKLWDLIKERCGKNDEDSDVTFSLQVSLDNFHQEPVHIGGGEVREKIPIENVANIIQVVSTKFPHMNLTIIGRFEPFMNEIEGALQEEMKKRGFALATAIVKTERRDVAFKTPSGGMNVERAASWKSMLMVDADGNPPRQKMIGFLRDFVMPAGFGELIEPFRLAYFPFSVHGATDGNLEGAKFMGGKAHEYHAIIISGDGNVYISDATFDNQWRAGNLNDDDLDTIMARVMKDPLFIAWRHNPAVVIGAITGVRPDIVDAIHDVYYPSIPVLSYLKSPALRLYLTKRIIQIWGELRFIDTELIQDLKWVAPFTEPELIAEYFINLSDEEAAPLRFTELQAALGEEFDNANEILGSYMQKRASFFGGADESTFPSGMEVGDKGIEKFKLPDYSVHEIRERGIQLSEDAAKIKAEHPDGLRSMSWNEMIHKDLKGASTGTACIASADMCEYVVTAMEGCTAVTLYDKKRNIGAVLHLATSTDVEGSIMLVVDKLAREYGIFSVELEAKVASAIGQPGTRYVVADVLGVLNGLDIDVVEKYLVDEDSLNTAIELETGDLLEVRQPDADESTSPSGVESNDGEQVEPESTRSHEEALPLEVDDLLSTISAADLAAADRYAEVFETDSFAARAIVNFAELIPRVINRRLRGAQGLRERMDYHGTDRRLLILGETHDAGLSVENILNHVIYELIQNANDEAGEGMITVSLEQTGAERFMLSVENEGALDREKLEHLRERLESYALDGKLWRDNVTGELIVERDDFEDRRMTDYYDYLRRSPDLYEHLTNARAAIYYVNEYLSMRGMEEIIFIEGLSRGKSRERGEYGHKGIGLALCKRRLMRIGGNISVDSSHINRTIFRVSFTGICLETPREAYEARRMIEIAATEKTRRTFIDLLRLLDRSGWLIQEKIEEPQKGRKVVVDPGYHDKEAFDYAYDSQSGEYVGPDERRILHVWRDHDFRDRAYYDCKINVVERIINDRIRMILENNFPDIPREDRRELLRLAGQLDITIYDPRFVSRPGEADESTSPSGMEAGSAGTAKVVIDKGEAQQEDAAFLSELLFLEEAKESLFEQLTGAFEHGNFRGSTSLRITDIGGSTINFNIDFEGGVLRTESGQRMDVRGLTFGGNPVQSLSAQDMPVRYEDIGVEVDDTGQEPILSFLADLVNESEEISLPGEISDAFIASALNAVETTGIISKVDEELAVSELTESGSRGVNLSVQIVEGDGLFWRVISTVSSDSVERDGVKWHVHNASKRNGLSYIDIKGWSDDDSAQIIVTELEKGKSYKIGLFRPKNEIARQGASDAYDAMESFSGEHAVALDRTIPDMYFDKRFVTLRLESPLSVGTEVGENADESTSPSGMAAKSDAKMFARDLAKFGIDIMNKNPGNWFGGVKDDVDWVMDEMRDIEERPVAPELEEMPVVDMVYSVEDIKKLPQLSEEGTHVKGMYIGLIKHNGIVIPTVVKMLEHLDDIRYESKIAQVLDRLGINPRFYGLVKDETGNIVGYAMQLAIGDEISPLRAIGGYEDDERIIRRRADEAGLIPTANYFITRTNNLIQLDAGNAEFNLMGRYTKYRKFLDRVNGAGDVTDESTDPSGIATSRAPVSGIDIAIKDIEAAVSLIIGNLRQHSYDEDTWWEIRYDNRRLTPEQRAIIESSYKTIAGLSGGRIKIIGSKTMHAEGNRVLSVSYKKNGQTVPLGIGHIEVPKDRDISHLRILGALNIAFAMASIPRGISQEDLKAHRLMGYIKSQYQAITGKPLELPDGPYDMETIRTIILRDLPEIRPEDIELYNKAMKAVLTAV